MFEAAAKALSQISSPSFRRVLLKAAVLALLVIALLGIALHRVFAWLASGGQAWAEATTGWHSPWQILAWVLSIAIALGIIGGAVFVMPAVTAFAGTFFTDEIGEQVERMHYPAEPVGRALPLWRAVYEGIKTGLIALAVYLCAVPFLLFAGIGFLIMFVASAYLLGREYFLLAAMRYRSPEEAKALRRAERTRIFLAGVLIAVFVSIPIVNFATPLFAMALMVHMHKRLSGGLRPELTEPQRA